MGRAAFLLLLPRVGEAALIRGPGARWGDGSDERGEERKTREGGKRKGSIESLQFFFPEESHRTFFPRKISPYFFSPKNLTKPLSTKKTFSQDLERRTSEAASRAEHPSAKRAVRLCARRDLLDLSLEGAADIFEESAKEKKGSGGVASTATAATAALYLRALRSRTSSLLDAWRSLLEDCETEAEAELAAAEERARAAEARAEAAEAALREQLTTPTTTAAPRPRPRPPPSSFAAAALPPPLPDDIAAITLVSSPTKLKNLEVGKPEAHAAAAAKRKGPLRLPPTEAEARALLEAERAAEGGEGEAFQMPPASEVETPLSAVVATAAAAAAAAATAARKGGSSLRGAPLPPQPPPLQRSSSSAASLLLLGLPGGGASSPATPGSPSLSLTALGKLAFFFLPRFFPPPSFSEEVENGKSDEKEKLTLFPSPLEYNTNSKKKKNGTPASVLDDIFACKSRADERARQAGATRPSLSQFLDSYLLARFGGAAFGAVAREWRGAIEGASAAAHRALFSDGDGGEASSLAASSSSSSSAALVEAAAFWLMLRGRLDEEWWLEAARLRGALAAELGGGLRSAAGGAGGAGAGGAGTPAAAASAPSSPARRSGFGGVAAAAVAAALDASASSPALLPAAASERAEWTRALEAALPTKALARAAARLTEESGSSGDSSSTAAAAAGAAVPRSLVLACALRASLSQRVGRLAPAADAFAAAAAAEAEEAGVGGGNEGRSRSSDASSLRPRAFRRFCGALAPGMRARDVAALLDALVPADGAAVAWSTAASALAAELEREERELEGQNA